MPGSSSDLRRGFWMVREGLRAARAYTAASAVIGAVSALVCLLILTTAGRTAAGEDRILASIDDAGVRVVLVAAQQGYAGMDHEVAERIGRLSAVEWAVGLGPPRDVRNTADGAGEPVSARTVLGPLPTAAVDVLAGRLPAPGEAVGTPEALAVLGLTEHAGAVLDGTTSYATVGVTGPGDVVSPVTDYILLRPTDGSDPGTEELVSIVVVAVTDPLDIPGLLPSLRALTGAPEADSVSITTSEDLAQVQQIAAGTFGELSRHLALAVGGVGALLIALTMAMSVTAHLRDFGRRRALGASRPGLLVMILTQAAAPAALGALAGTAIGAVVVHVLTAQAPSPTMLLATVTLTLVAAVAGAVPGALVGALKDPVSILRVP